MMASKLEEKTQILKDYTTNLEKTVEERTKDLVRINQNWKYKAAI